MATGGREPIFPVGLDDDALAEDLTRLSRSGRETFAAFSREFRRRGGLPLSHLMACQAEGRDGTRLAGCVKTYVPWPHGRYGGVFVAVTHPERPLALRLIAFGIRHQPPASKALTVYQLAHRRLLASEA